MTVEEIQKTLNDRYKKIYQHYRELSAQIAPVQKELDFLLNLLDKIEWGDQQKEIAAAQKTTAISRDL